MNKLPERAECRCVLSDGSVVTVTATRRPRGTLADVKCSVPGSAALAERMQQVVRLARHTEAAYDSRDQVVLSMDHALPARERDWELAAVLADRLVRGVWCARQPVVANGWSDAWELGRVGGHSNEVAGAILGGQLQHLGALYGQPDAAAAVSSARTWFPLHSGGASDALNWVEVSVYPLAHDGEDPVSVTAADVLLQQGVRDTVQGARSFDGRATGRWRTVVRFGETRFQGNSYELALVMADRMARGREFMARGRIIATGCSRDWHAGKVDAVEGQEAKCALMLEQAMAGDRVLLPKAWEGAGNVAEALRAKGASACYVERIGLI